MSNALGAAMADRVERSTTTAWLALGDALVIVAFLALGALRHNADPIGQPVRMAGIAAPFLIGWIIAAPPAGVYAAKVRQSVRLAVVLTVVAWLSASIIGSALRATEFFHGNAPLTFVAVTFGVGAVFLGVWRAVVARFFGA